MKATAIITLAVLLSGCMAEVLSSTAIQGELQAQQLKSVKGHMDHAKEMNAKLSLQQAINAYRAEKGMNPPSLDALIPEWIPAIPRNPDGTPLGYDPRTGQVLDHGAEPEDLQMI